jgi:transcriptional regulator with XRE-family HTH domain
MSINKDFGNNLRKIRLGKGITQEKLAALAKLHRTYISDVERGSRNVSLNNIEKLSKALKVDLREMFNF